MIFRKNTNYTQNDDSSCVNLPLAQHMDDNSDNDLNNSMEFENIDIYAMAMELQRDSQENNSDKKEKKKISYIEQCCISCIMCSTAVWACCDISYNKCIRCVLGYCCMIPDWCIICCQQPKKGVSVNTATIDGKNCTKKFQWIINCLWDNEIKGVNVNDIPLKGNVIDSVVQITNSNVKKSPKRIVIDFPNSKINGQDILFGEISFKKNTRNSFSSKHSTVKSQ